MTEDALWSAPHARGPVLATVEIPGTKSGTNRFLVLAAQSTRTVRISKPLWARDTRLMAAGLQALGIEVRVDETSATVTGPEAGAPIGDPRMRKVDCGNAGTVARFLPPFAALNYAPAQFDGDPRMRERPLAPLINAMSQLGATVEHGMFPGMPLSVCGPLKGGSVEINASDSSQLVSGLLLAGPGMADGVTVTHVGPPIPSLPHIGMTVAALRLAGASVETDSATTWSVAAGPIALPDVTVEPDLSTASAFLAAAAATGGAVTIPDWPIETEQPGRLLSDLLTAMGCSTTFNDNGLTVTGPETLIGIDVDLHEYGESAPTMTALAVLASTPSRLRGIAHLRLQETDRLAALSDEFGKLGAKITVEDDGLSIEPAPLSAGAALNPQADHRLAMAYAVVGLVVPGVQIMDIATTGKTISDFPQRWSAMVGVDD